jgi:hypothetical protein
VFTFQGIAVDSYVMFVKECTVVGKASGPEIEVELGHSAGSLHLVTDLDGLRKLVDVLSELRRLVEAHPEDAPLDVRVPARPAPTAAIQL